VSSKNQGTVVGTVLVTALLVRGVGTGFLGSGESEKGKTASQTSGKQIKSGEGPWVASCDYWASVRLPAGTALYPRPNVSVGVPQVLYGPQYPGGKAFNSAAFTPAPQGQQGNLGRNVLRAFGATQLDLAAQRQFRITEKVSLHFRSEFFNIFNHPNFGPPINDLTSPLFGVSTQTLASSLGSGGANGGLNPLYQIGGPRSIQLALKLQF